MAGNTVGKELLDYYNYHPDTVSASVFSQQRAKLLPYALDYLFHSFTESFERLRTYQGYRLIACDGSALAIAHNPQDTMTHRRHNSLERHGKGWKYLIRIKDIGSRGILTKLPLPDTAEFDFNHTLILTKKQTKEIKAQPEKYRFLSNKSPCDFLDPVTNPYYTLRFRIARFKITEDSYECIITNLPSEEFGTEELKKLYGLRWGIERSFRELKYTIGLRNFHAKKVG